MRAPRLGIAWIMAFSALVALDFGAIRAWSDIRGRSREVLGRGPKDPAEFDRIMDILIRTDLLVTGALPMGNILAVGLMSHRGRRNRPFLLGFEAFGATALALYIAGVSYLTYEELRPCLDLVLDPLKNLFGRSMTTASILGIYSAMAMMLILPQMAFALFGGFLFRRFRNSRAERPDPLLMGQ